MPPFKILLLSATVGALTVLSGCGSPELRTSSGTPVKQPLVIPGNNRELTELCDFEALGWVGRDAQAQARYSCRKHVGAAIGQRRQECLRALRGKSSNEIDQCVRINQDFKQSMALAHQYREFGQIKTDEDRRQFIARHAQQDGLKLVDEVRLQLARSCGAGVALDGPAQAATAWLDSFGMLGPEHCTAQRQLAQRVLRRQALREAAGDHDKLMRMLVTHAGPDPDGYLAQARNEATSLWLQQERSALAGVASWRAAEEFLARFGADPRSQLQAQGQARRDELRRSELQQLRDLPLLELRRRLARDGAGAPAAWTQAAQAVLADRAPKEEQALLSSLSAEGLRRFLKEHSVDAIAPEAQATAQGMAAALALLRQQLGEQIAKGSDAEREALLVDPHATPELRKLASQRLTQDYLQRREFGPVHRLYQLTQDVSLLQAGQGFARSAPERLLLEQAAVEWLKSPGRLFEVSGEFEGNSPAGDMQRNAGFFANFTATANQRLKGLLRIKPQAQSPLRLRQGHYEASVRISWRVDRKRSVRSSVLGSRDEDAPASGSQTVKVRLSPPHYQASLPFDLGVHSLGYFQSGSMGGYTAIQLTGEPVATLEVVSLKAVN
ncbi:hypothetical protein [Roseateles microcysteis]|uniref:hypothetical protein n=1 Tax=Roseateles microcysteis TaxID=3119057 RepID=UPI002FE6196C